MRHLIVAMLVASVASPALAASRHADDADMARAAQHLNDPVMQSAVSGMVVAMADMVMDLRVDKLRGAIAAVDPDVRNDDNDPRTLGDMIARDDPNFRDRIADDSRKAMGTMGAVAGSMAAMLPEFRAMANRMEDVIARMPVRNLLDAPQGLEPR